MTYSKSSIEKSGNLSNKISFNELINLISKKLSVDKQLTTIEIDHEYLKGLLNRYISFEPDWIKFALQDGKRSYTRNGICDFKENGNLLLLVWNPGQSSAIHNHSNAHCCMKILKGVLTEELFNTSKNNNSSQTMKPFKKTTLLKNDVAYISDNIGLHKISNKTNEIAISLHLYTPPYAKKYGCYVYSDVGKKTHVNMANLYSWNGEIINHDNHSNC